ncbi:MAG TPA: hypothetical protein PL070_14025, partial [Flavobacteriales bacterium]|nr:hypothetical protein [Flavobacteriales bacterium]
IGGQRRPELPTLLIHSSVEVQKNAFREWSIDGENNASFFSVMGEQVVVRGTGADPQRCLRMVVTHEEHADTTTQIRDMSTVKRREHQ